jgi:nucleotide-binding universal stress UspA family protein
MKKILAAVDFSNATAQVVEMAVRMAGAFGADVELLHVIEPSPGFVAYGFTPVDYPPLDAYQEEERHRATRKLKELLNHVHADLPAATSHMAVGSPLHELLAYVGKSGADLVILGSHGHGMISAMLLGSVAEGMVRKATVPTLIMPAPPE